MASEHTVNLWDLPSAWVVQFMTCLSSRELQCLLTASTTCRNLVLKHARSTTLGFPLLEKKSSLSVMLGSLQLTSQHSNSICLNLHHGDKQRLPAVVHEDTPARDLFTQMAYALLKVAHGMQLTTALTQLHLKDARLDSPLPLAVSQACPNLTRLLLEGAWLDWDTATATSFSGSYPKLEILKLDQGQCNGDGTQWHGLLQQQLGQLTTLQSLTLKGSGGSWQGFSAMGDGVLAAQLTHLAVNVASVRGPAHMLWLQPARAVQLVNLHRLVIDGSTVGDAELQVLLSLRSLDYLKVFGFSLRSSFADQPVRWQQLTMTKVQVEQLAKLPLGNSSLQLTVHDVPRPGKVIIAHLLGTDMAIIDQALVNISRCKGLGWAEKVGARLGTDWALVEPHLKEQLLDKMLQLVTGAKTLSLTHVELSQCNVQAIHAFLHRSPECNSVSLLGTCTWTWLACATVMDCMPAARTLRMQCDKEAGVTKLCCMAEKPISLMLESRVLKPDGFLERVREAMRLCGHQHVKVYLRDKIFH